MVGKRGCVNSEIEYEIDLCKSDDDGFLNDPVPVQSCPLQQVIHLALPLTASCAAQERGPNKLRTWTRLACFGTSFISPQLVLRLECSRPTIKSHHHPNNPLAFTYPSPTDCPCSYRARALADTPISWISRLRIDIPTTGPPLYCLLDALHHVCAQSASGWSAERGS